MRLRRGGGDMARLYRRSYPGYTTGAHRRITCEITLEPLRTTYLFAPLAVESMSLPREVWLTGNEWHHAFSYKSRKRLPLNYTVTSRLFTPGPPTTSRPPLPYERALLPHYLQLPDEISSRVRQLAAEIAPEDECPDDYAKAKRILDYLSDGSVFAYSLEMNPTPGEEPVGDFLLNRKTGHCEYFAAAMVVLLRATGVPARLVNGFKVSEWNPIANYYVVRQSDAHSWVEAYLRPDGWRTFDPSVFRDDFTPEPIFVRKWWRNLYDLADTLWVRYVLTYDAERQSALQTAIVRGAQRTVRTAERLWTRAFLLAGGDFLAIHRWEARRLLRRIAPWFRRGLLIVIVVLGTVLAGLAAGRLRTWLRRRTPGHGVLRAYGRMERLLARRGFPRNPSQTPWELHAAVAARHWPGAQAVERVTRAFCEVRYGGRPLSSQRAQTIAEALRTIRETKRHRRHGEGSPDT